MHEHRVVARRRGAHASFVLRLAVWAALALVLCSCTTATLNVRARRAYASEEPLFEVTASRADDLVAIAELLDRLLLHTPYTPGADWVGGLALTDERAEHFREQLLYQRPYALEEHEIPIIKLYRLHLQQVLRKAKTSSRGDERYRNVFAAFDDLLPQDQSFVLWLGGFQRAQEAWETATLEQHRTSHTHWPGPTDAAADVDPQHGSTLAERHGAAIRALHASRLGADVAMANLLELSDSLKHSDVTQDPRGQLARDGLAIVSVAYRLDLESLALLPTALSHATESVRDHDGRQPVQVGKRQLALAST